MENIDFVPYFLYHNFSNSLSCSTFPTGMKYAEVTPIHKKDDKTDRKNYQPMSILPNISRDVSRLNLIAVDRYRRPKKYAQKCFCSEN